MSGLKLNNHYQPMRVICIGSLFVYDYLVNSPIFIMLKRINIIPIIYLIFVTLWLRLANLGYSNYQGDEIKALYRPQPDRGMVDFLLSQRKGPVQFLVTYLMGIFNPGYDSEFIMRLPFAIAAILSVYFFYKFVKLEFGEKVALYSSMFMATNGLFVAFSRIVQYQSFVILFSILALYCFCLSTKYQRWQVPGLYLGACCWVISILSHYDGIFIAPIAAYLLYRNYSGKRNQLKHLVAAGAIVVVSLSIFYVPFYISIPDSTIAYWTKRISKQSVSSITTFSAYNTLPIFCVYVIFSLLSLLKIKENFGIVLWLLFPLVSLETLVGNPGTHIFTYTLPLCILAAFGLLVLEDFITHRYFHKVKLIKTILVSTIYLITFCLAHFIFIDNIKEYPWSDKKVLFLSLKRQRRLSLFGFPYYRHWEKIGAYLENASERGYFITNEKKSIPRYYIPAGFKNLDEHPYDNSASEVFVIYIQHPQSSKKKILDREFSYWQQKYKPIQTYSNRGRVVTNIYRLSASEWGKEVEVAR